MSDNPFRNENHMPSRLTVWSAVMFVAVACMAGAVFQTSQSANNIENNIQAMNKALINERQAIRVLDAEWAYLTRPQRIEELVAMRNDMPVPLKVLPVKAAKVAPDVKVEATPVVAAVVEAPVAKVVPVAAPVPARVADVRPTPSARPAPEVVKVAPVVAPANTVARAPQKDVDVWPIQARKQQVAVKPAPSASLYKPASASAPAFSGRMRPIVE